MNYSKYIILFLLSCFLVSESIYQGQWPSNINRNEQQKSNLIPKCPNDIGCPCNINEDCINNNCIKIPRGSYCMPNKGDYFPNFEGLDQFNEIVNIYDFSHQNKYILIEMSAEWCSPCHTLSNWLSYKDEDIYNQKWWKKEYDIIYDLIHNGEVYFITILYEDRFRENATYDTADEWYRNYPDDKIPILVDSEKHLHSWLKPAGIPAITLLDENMQIIEYTNRGLNVAFDKLIKIYNTTDNE